MSGPAPSQLLVLVNWLRRMAAAHQPVPGLDGMAAALGVADRSRVSDLLRQGQERGLLVVTYARGGIASIAAPDGSWCCRRGKERLPERACLRCRRPFEPAHKHNFLCGCPEFPQEPRGISARRAEA